MPISHDDLLTLARTAGYIGLFLIIFAESGLFFGFFLPGDSLLFTAGFLASQGYFNIAALVLVLFVAAVLGDSVGYAFGRKVGPRLFTRDDSKLFHRDHIARAQHFYERHGKKAIVLARFVPIVRTFAPIVAGIGSMHYATFLTYNLIGAGLWAVGVTLLGYILGASIPGIDAYLLPIISGIILVSFLPVIIEYLKKRRTPTP